MNAIILAAGKGNRLLPFTEKTPKPLLQIFNENIIERQIRFLKEAHISHITIVAGYLHQKFQYLKYKYQNVEIVINNLFDSSNNFYSLFLVRHKLKNTWIIEGDIFLVKNVFMPHEKSVYYSSLKPIIEYEWYFKHDSAYRVQSIHIADRRTFSDMFTEDYNILMGISFWNDASCTIINSLFESIQNDEKRFDEYKNSYWDKLIYDNLDRFELYIHLINKDSWYEIDSVRDLNELNRIFQLETAFRLEK